MDKKTIELDFSESIAAMNQSGIVVKLIQLQTQFKIFHWQTFSFAHHNAFGGLYDALSESIDEFVETYQGIYGRFDFGGTSFSMTNLSDADFISILNDNIQTLTQYEMIFNNTDLLNIRDEILGSINRTKYLLTLN
jgi:hypothetical protein